MMTRNWTKFGGDVFGTQLNGLSKFHLHQTSTFRSIVVIRSNSYCQCSPSDKDCGNEYSANSIISVVNVDHNVKFNINRESEDCFKCCDTMNAAKAIKNFTFG